MFFADGRAPGIAEFGIYDEGEGVQAGKPALNPKNPTLYQPR